MREGGCAFGKVNRQMIEDTKQNIAEGFKQVRCELESIKQENKVLYNHLSTRINPRDARLINILVGVISILGGIVIGAIIAKVL